MDEPEGRGAAESTAGWGVLEQAGELTRRGQAFALATVVWRQGPSSGHQGSRAIITASGELHGWIGGAGAEPAPIREAPPVISQGTPPPLPVRRTQPFSSTLGAPSPSVVPPSLPSPCA